MANTSNLSAKTRKNLITDIFLFISATGASITGIIFLFFPGGNSHRVWPLPQDAAWYADWRLWDSIHTWTGVIMILIAVIHLMVHWQWVVSITKRYIRELSGDCGCKMNIRSRLNLLVNVLMAISFFLTSISGIYFMYFPRGGRNLNAEFDLLIRRSTWGDIHTWAGVALIVCALIHLVFHWRWITKTIGKVFHASASMQTAEQVSLSSAL